MQGNENATKSVPELEVVGGGGCVRQISEGRGSYELISPFVIERDAKLLEWGAKNRGRRNWEKGCPFSRCMQSLLRHAYKYMAGEPDTDHDDNLAAIRFWAGAMIHYEEMIDRGLLPESLKDFPDYSSGELFRASIEKESSQQAQNPEIKLEARCQKKEVAIVNEHMVSSAKRQFASHSLRIYVAGPITGISPDIRAFNYDAGNAAGKMLLELGHLPFVPHRYETKNDTDTEYEELLNLDFSIIEQWAQALYVIAPSPGTSREIDLAQKLGLPIYRSMNEVPQILEDSGLMTVGTGHGIVIERKKDEEVK